MDIATQIQNLRKANGMSQEDLADKICVTRQAVSKWESGQSVPDIEKVITLSELFNVTTDYLLKGTEAPRQAGQKLIHANIFTIVATVLDFIGLIVSCAVWYEEQVPMALVIGLILTALGCMVFLIGMVISEPSERAQAKRNFWSINIWFISFMPVSFLYNMLITGLPAPYPMFVLNGIPAFLIMWLVYFALCLTVVRLHRKGDQ
ncbi:MAG TPA: helix-turn-helix transcriptional regulator [Candidatus Limiplasma sp.]|nr:helix-turn-helix transcriptional regulator [Candidatus Limiplasma sp.]